MKIISKYHKELIVLGVIIEIILIPLIFKNIISLKNKDDNDNSIPSVNEIGKQEFGIMYRDSDTDSYKEYNGSIIDAVNNKYVLNVNNSKCSDGSGAIVIPGSVLSINGSTVTIKSNKTVYCTLYFDKKKTINALDIVASKPNSLSPNADQGDMYRYQGTSELVNNNYICFGTDNKVTCIGDEDHYMYRIIGITEEGEMKLIKQTPIVEQGNTVFSWFKQYGIDGTGVLFGTAENGLETWPESVIYKRLNGLSNGNIIGSGQSSSNGTNNDYNSNTNIFVDSYTNEYPYMKKTSEWYSKISSHEWMYGNSIELFDYNGYEMYKVETGNRETKYIYLDKITGSYVEGTYTWNKETDEVTAKIGLPYIHDLYFTYFDGLNDNTRGIPGSSDLGNSWILTLASKSLSTMTSCPNIALPFPGDNSLPCIASWDGSGVALETDVVGSMVYIQGYSHLPVFYVLNTVEMEGSGIETDPYRIVN